ncbi:hypothetical protein [Clostridium sp.]|jgi:hypothetical protein|uniref:hypothetical protein n=1 Tax=Clostridium sp. TaxID=1506 RepID=UPI003A5C6DEF
MLIDILKRTLHEKGLYPFLMILFSWTYAFILLLSLLCELILYTTKVKYCNPDFQKKEDSKKQKHN